VNSSIKEKKVLVTGASGFIGSHLVRRLLKEGAEVHIFIRKGSSHFRIYDIIPDLIVWEGNLEDWNSTYSCIKNSKPQIIFHLASFRNVERNFELINHMIDTNIKGTVNLIKAVIDEKITLECFINTGTCEEYGNAHTPFHEDQRETPVSPYSASKVATTHLCQMVFKTMELPTITLRPFLTYGPYQDTDMFIPSLIYHCLNGKDFPMTEGTQTREFNYIDDVVDAYLFAAASRGAVGEIINIGNGVEYRIKDVAEKIVNMMDNPIRLLIGALPKRLGETSHFFCSNEKAKELLGWSPKVGLDEGLEKTIRWYRIYFGLPRTCAG